MCCMIKSKGNTTVLEAKQCTFWTLVKETSLFVDNAWLCLQLDHGAAHLASRSFVQKKAVLSPCFPLSCCMFIRSRSVTWRLFVHDMNRCTFWTSCTVSRKHPFLPKTQSFGYSWLAQMQILVGWVLHTGTEYTLKMSYLGCFCFLSARERWWRKGNTIVH